MSRGLNLWGKYFIYGKLWNWKKQFWKNSEKIILKKKQFKKIIKEK